MQRNYRDENKSGPTTTGRILIKNTLWNFLGQAMPLLVALVSMPILIRGLGTDRFGVLTLAWMVVGYFSLFDIGLGRATTKLAAQYIATNDFDLLSRLVWTSLISLLGFGLVGGLAITILTPWLIIDVLKVPAHLTSETMKAFHLLALSVPFVLATSGARGVLEAQQKFGLVNAIKIPASITAFIAPLLVLPFSSSLYPIVAVLVASRFLVFFIYLYFCKHSHPSLKQKHLPDIDNFKELITFGGWLTITNIVSPLMTYMDRFVVGMVLSMHAVAYYATSYDLVTRLLIISGSLLGALFPLFNAYAVIDKTRFSQLFDMSVMYLHMVITPIAFTLVVMAEPFLTVWVGHDFAQNGTGVLQILSIGLLINSLAQVPFTALQAMGRPDLTAKLHLLELPLYLGVLWFITPKLGINGVAFAWLLRVIADTACLFWFYRSMTAEAPKARGRLFRLTVGNISAMLLSLGITSIFPGLSIKILIVLIYIVCFVAFSWRLLQESEKVKLKTLITGIPENLNDSSQGSVFNSDQIHRESSILTLRSPNVIIAGAPRCGTTSVFDWLSDHPQVCASRIKETCYFMDEDYPLFNKKANYHYHGMKKYGLYFKQCKKSGTKVILEATPDYLYQKTALAVLPALKPKIIFLLRKPSERVYSFIRFAQNNMSVLNNDFTFAEVIARVEANSSPMMNDYLVQNVINHSCYVNYIKKWIDAFGKENIYVFLLEHLKENPVAFMKSLSKSLDIDGSFWNTYAFKKSNESYLVDIQLVHRLKGVASWLIPELVRKSFFKKTYYAVNIKQPNQLSTEDRHILEKLDKEFRPYNDALAGLLKMDLSIWQNNSR